MSNRSKEAVSIIKGSFKIKNDRGLHTRPSAELVKCAAMYKSQITLIYRKTRVNAKSLLGILMLAAAKGAKIQVEAEGHDAAQAIASLQDLASNSFNMHY